MHATGTEICHDCKRNYLPDPDPADVVLVSNVTSGDIKAFPTYSYIGQSVTKEEYEKLTYRPLLRTEDAKETLKYDGADFLIEYMGDSTGSTPVITVRCKTCCKHTNIGAIDSNTGYYDCCGSRKTIPLHINSVYKLRSGSTYRFLGKPQRESRWEEMTPNKVSRDPLIYVSANPSDLQFTIKPSMVNSRISYKIKEKTAQCLGRQVILDCLVLLAYKNKITSIDMFKFENHQGLSQAIVEKVVNLWESI
jgi:hypothetical protein